MQILNNIANPISYSTLLTQSPLYSSTSLILTPSSIYTQSFTAHNLIAQYLIAQQNKCIKIQYIDCRNWYDFSQQILITILSFLLFLHVAKHYRNLKKQKQQIAITQHQKSIRRKIRVNLVIIIYLFCFILNTLYNLTLYYWYRKQPDQIIGTFDKLYKVTQVLYVNWLNVLNLTVGFLYWKATRAYYVLSEIQVSVLFRPYGKVAFVIFFCINASAVVMTCIFLFVIDTGKDPIQQQKKQRYYAILSLFSITLSIFICISCRLLYRFHILTKLQLSPIAITKQKIMSFLLFISSFLRICLYCLDFIYPQWMKDIRDQQYNQQEQIKCMDYNISYSFILLAINLLINLLPAAIYGYLFVSEVELKKSRNRLLSSSRSQQSYQSQ